MLGGSADDRNNLAAPHPPERLVMHLPGLVQSLTQRIGLHDHVPVDIYPTCSQDTNREIMAIPAKGPRMA